jgi:uncharacterized protein with PIN domain
LSQFPPEVVEEIERQSDLAEKACENCGKNLLDAYFDLAWTEETKEEIEAQVDSVTRCPTCRAAAGI